MKGELGFPISLITIHFQVSQRLLHRYIEDAQHNQEPAISIAAEDIQGLELSGDTNTAMPQIHDSTADTNANEEQAQAS